MDFIKSLSTKNVNQLYHMIIQRMGPYTVRNLPQNKNILISILIKWYNTMYCHKLGNTIITKNKGPRPTMEDFVINEKFKDIQLVGVFDGHGGDYISKHLPLYMSKLLSKIHANRYDKLEIINLIRSHYVAIDIQFLNNKNIQLMNTGSTSALAMCFDKKIYTIHSGDSRCIVFTKDKLIHSTKDHKPHVPTERKRIESSKHIPSKVLFIHGIPRINGKLAVSRGFGDFEYKISKDKKV